MIREIGSLENRKKNAENQAWEKLVRCKYKFALIVVVPIILWLCLVYKLDWNFMEKISYFPPVVYALLTFIYAMIYGKSFNPLKYFAEKYNKYVADFYSAFEYSDSEYSELVQLRDGLKNELGN